MRCLCFSINILGSINKKLVMLSRFWLLVEGGGGRGGHALIEIFKNKICYKNLFSDNAE